MTYVFDLDHPHEMAQSDLAALIGGKAAGLSLMTTELGLPVPPGFAITTEACRAFLSAGWPDGLDAELTSAMRRLELAAGRRFGDEANPLLLSVRSGAPVSMPGMMDTILNLGLNDETERGLAAASGDPSFAADSRRRLAEMFTTTVGVRAVPDDPWQQLRMAIEAVFGSWTGERARAFRSREGISDSMGTAVTVQAMVFGNWGGDSATGVVFTRNPATGEHELYGDVLFASQGEDVVAGTHRTEPLSVLDSRLPAAAAELRRHAAALERRLADLCDIEFTIERGRLWLLQVRVGKRSPHAALRIAFDMAEDPDFPLTRMQAVERVAGLLASPPAVSTGRPAGTAPLVTGRPASPGVASGEIATSSSSAVSVAEQGRPVILVRSETSPEDVAGMAKSAGVLTSTGGLASHAAVVARGWGIPAVVGAEAMTVGTDVVRLGGRVLKPGEVITIDGGTGEVFAGVVEGGTSVAPEAVAMLAWAETLGVRIGAPRPAAGSPRAAGPAATSDDLLRMLLVKGSASPEGVSEALMADAPAIKALFDEIVAAGLAESFADGFRLTAQGRHSAAEQLDDDRRRWGAERAEAALGGFHDLDMRLKETVTAWQLRDMDGAQRINDHSDAAYDAGVLERLAEVHRATSRWLSTLGRVPRRLDLYLARLDAALAAVRGGDHRYVASPRVDSYHSIWFELHEELILLAGRSRADEAAAGRA